MPCVTRSFIVHSRFQVHSRIRLENARLYVFKYIRVVSRRMQLYTWNRLCTMCYEYRANCHEPLHMVSLLFRMYVSSAGNISKCQNVASVLFIHLIYLICITRTTNIMTTNNFEVGKILGKRSGRNNVVCIIFFCFCKCELFLKSWVKFLS